MTRSDAISTQHLGMGLTGLPGSDECKAGYG
jgi:hypothetical protein